MKTPSPLRGPAGLALGTALALAFTGCASTARPPAPGPTGQIVVVEYDTVYVIGSHIPVLVPRSPTARTLPTISPTVTLTPDDIRYGMGGMRPPMH